MADNTNVVVVSRSGGNVINRVEPLDNVMAYAAEHGISLNISDDNAVRTVVGEYFELDLTGKNVARADNGNIIISEEYKFG